MSNTINLKNILEPHCAGLRLDQALALTFSDYSRGQLTKWIKAGHVEVNGKILKPKDTVWGGEEVQITASPVEKETSWQAEPIALDIVAEDDDILIINKPAGMVVHPGAGNHDGTLVNALLHHCPALEHIPRAGIVHRIDKQTTGLLMIAKTLLAHNSLVTQLQERTVQREYQAIVVGVMTAGGTVEGAIGRHHIDRKRMAITTSGKPATTHYRVVHRYREHTHITCKLETGRTHQIRVHMAHIRYPLLGDPVYGGRLKLPKGASQAFLSVLQQFKRQALHAGLLGFTHPKTGEHVSWRVDIPDDMKQVLAALKQDQEQPDQD